MVSRPFRVSAAKAPPGGCEQAPGPRAYGYGIRDALFVASLYLALLAIGHTLSHANLPSFREYLPGQCLLVQSL